MKRPLPKPGGIDRLAPTNKARRAYERQVQERVAAMDVYRLIELASTTQLINEALHTAMTPAEIMLLPEEFIAIVRAWSAPPVLPKKGLTHGPDESHGSER